jgi:hypothetical protein
MSNIAAQPCNSWSTLNSFWLKFFHANTAKILRREKILSVISAGQSFDLPNFLIILLCFFLNFHNCKTHPERQRQNNNRCMCTSTKVQDHIEVSQIKITVFQLSKSYDRHKFPNANCNQTSKVNNENLEHNTFLRCWKNNSYHPHKVKRYEYVKKQRGCEFVRLG